MFKAKFLFSKIGLNLVKNEQFLNFQKCSFTGKTETGWKFTTPILKMKNVKPIQPPPGDNLKLPGKTQLTFLDWTPQKFCDKIGGDCYEIADKFETLEEILACDSVKIDKLNFNRKL